MDFKAGLILSSIKQKDFLEISQDFLEIMYGESSILIDISQCVTPTENLMRLNGGLYDTSNKSIHADCFVFSGELDIHQSNDYKWILKVRAFNALKGLISPEKFIKIASSHNGVS